MDRKESLRKKILYERKSFDEIKHFSANNDIIAKVSDFLNLRYRKWNEYTGRKSKLIIGLYWPIKGEPDLLKLTLDSKFTIALPKIRGDNIDFVKYEIGAELETSIFNKMKHPVNNVKVIPDIFIVPGMGFSLTGYRLGFGIGQYDKYFAHVDKDVDKDVIKIGVCFHENIYEYLPHESHDIKMDYMITDKVFIACRHC